MSKSCQICRNKINTRAKKAREAKKTAKADEIRGELREEVQHDNLDSWFRQMDENFQVLDETMNRVLSDLKLVKHKLGIQ